MRFKPGDDVVIVDDSFNFGLPLNAAAKVLRIDRNSDHAQNYCIRIPLKKENWWVSEQDIEFSTVINSSQADKMIKDHLVDLSLTTNDKELFHRATESSK